GESATDYDRAVELSPPAEKPLVRRGQARTLALTGEPARAFALVNELAAAPGATGQLLFELAGVCATAAAAAKGDEALRERCAARAVALLERAAERGAVSPALLQDRSLLPLRDRADFNRLLKRLREKPAPDSP